MSNVLLGWPLWSDVGVSYTPVLSGGSWAAGLPLGNLQDSDLSLVARSTDDSEDSTIIKADLGADRPVRTIGLYGHNLSMAARWRARLLAALPIVDDADVSGWLLNNTPIVTGGQADPLGGTRGTLLEDDNAAGVDALKKLVSFTGDGSKILAACVKPGNALVTELGIYDVTAGAARGYIRLTWSTMAVTVGAGSGAGTALVALGGGWYYFEVRVDNIVAANSNYMYLFPCSSSPAVVGTSYFFGAQAWDVGYSPSIYDSGVLNAWPSPPPFSTRNDFDAFSNPNAAIITGGQADPDGGSRAWLVEDDDAATNELLYPTTPGFTGTGPKSISICMKAGTAAVTDLDIYDNTTMLTPYRLRATWAAGVPVMSNLIGDATIATPESLGDGWYRVHFSVNEVIGANSIRVRLFPAGNVVTQTGTVYVYNLHLWNIVVPDVDPALYVTAEVADGLNVPTVAILDAALNARYVRIEIGDSNNADGYVEAGRLAITGGIQPEVNMVYGAKLGLKTSTREVETDGGAFLFDERPGRREAIFTLPSLTHEEAVLTMLNMMQRTNVVRQLVFFYDPSDTTLLHAQSFLARYRELSALEHSQYDRRGLSLALIEEL